MSRFFRIAFLRKPTFFLVLFELIYFLEYFFEWFLLFWVISYFFFSKILLFFSTFLSKFIFWVLFLVLFWDCWSLRTYLRTSFKKLNFAEFMEFVFSKSAGIALYFQKIICPTEGILSNSAPICAIHFSDPCSCHSVAILAFYIVRTLFYWSNYF